MPELRSLRAVLAGAAIALGACGAPPAADPECQAYRSWFPQRASIGVHDECVRQFGEAYCRKCLIE